MGMFPGRRRASLFLVLTLLLSVGFTGALAQDAPPDAPPETTATVVPPTATSTLTPAPTATPAATATAIPPATTAAPETTDEPAPETTDEPASTATDAPTVTPSATPLPAEPPLALLASDLFEGAAFGNWQPGADWSLAPADAGQSARTDGASPLAWAGGPYLNAAVQARFLLPNGGSAVISLRRSAETLAYAAALDASGQVTLYRAGAPVAFAAVAPLAPDEWRALRLSAVNAVVRVSVNGVEAIAWGDAAPLPPGTVALAAANLPAGGGALADDFGLWVPLSELALYPTPTPPPSATPTATLVPTAVPATPTPAATSEPEATEETALATPTPAPELTETVESTAEPEATTEPEATEETALITPTLAPESTAEPEATSEPEATEEATPEVTAEPTPAVTDEPVGPDGKSLTPNQVDEPVAGLAAAEDLPAGAILIPAIPFSASGTTNRADLGSAGEPAPTCGFNITRTLWYRFVVPAAGPYTVTSAGSAFDTILAAYTDPFSAPAALLGCSDDASPTDLTSRLNLNLTAGQTIYIQLGGYNGFSGPYTLRVQQTNVPLPWPARQLAPRYAGTLWDTDGVADITFEWAPLSVGTVYEPASYQLQVARSVWFTDLVYDSSGLTAQSATRAFDTPGAYYWRVRGLNVNDQPGAWSAVWLFYVNTAPAAPTLYLPADASVTTLTRPTLIWLPTVGAGGYRVDVSTSSTFSSFALENQPAVANYLVLPAALSQGRYFWRVQAVDAAGSPGPESAAFQLDINIGHTPASNAAFTTYPTLPTARPTFVWVPQAGAPTYTLEIATSETFGASIVYSVEVPVHYHVLPLANALPDGVYFWRVRVGGEALPPPIFQRFTVSPPPAPAPVQTGPAYAAQLSSTAPPLAWNPVPPSAAGGPFTYELQLDRTGWFNSPALLTFTQADGVTAAGFTVPGPLADGVWAWRVRAVNAQGRPGYWSPAYLFYVDTVAPPAPTLYLPASASVTTLTRPTLIWLPAAGASGYRVDVSTSSTFNSFALENQPAVANYLALPAALSQGRYFWRVQALDAAGNLSPESAAFQLDINIGHTPASNAAFTTYPTLPTARPTFVWVPQAGATAYTLEIATSETFGASIVYSTDLTLYYHALPLANALPDGVYFWRVRVGGEALPPTIFQRFTVSPPPAPAPLQTGPAYAAQLSSTAPPLAWNPVSAAGGPFTYELQLDRTGWFNSPALLTFTQADGVTAAGFTVPGPLADGAWAWRVRVVNAQGRPGYWSPAYLFYVDTVAPPAPTLYLPANASVTTLTRPTLIWLPAAGASGYRVDVSTSSTFNSFALENQPAVANYLALPAALSQGRYFWRVQAVDAAGNLSPESAAFQLDINIGHTPASNAAFTTYPTLPTARPTFVWVPQPGATAYTLEIATSETFGASIVYSVEVPVHYHALPLANALPDGVYFWRVRVGGEALPPPIFQRFTVSPPPAPAPLQTGPAYAAQLSSTAPPLAWNPVPPTAAGGPFTYELQLDRTGWFNSPALLTFTQADGVTAAGFTVPGPLADGAWAWRVRAVNAQGRPGYWSPAYLFYVDTVAPPAPTLYLPASNSAVYTRQPAFIWLPTVGAARYEIALSTNPAFTAPLLAPAAWNYYVPTSPLLLTTYSWRVRAFDAAGNVSAWSDTRTLKVESPAYSAPLLNRYTAAPTLTWTPVSWAQAYHLQVAQDAAFTRLVYDNETLAAGALQAAPGALPNGSYYWRVRARSGAAAWGWWSTPGMFLVDSGS